MIRCIKSHTEGGLFYTPIAATHVVEGHIYELHDQKNGQLRTNSGWHPEECFEDTPPVRLFYPGDKIRCTKQYKYFDYYDGFRLEIGKEYTVKYISPNHPEKLIDCSRNIDDFYSYHFFIGLEEDYSNVVEDAFYPEHYFELMSKFVSPIQTILQPKSQEQIERDIAEMTPSEKLLVYTDQNDLEGIKQALEEGADINFTIEEGESTALEIAVYNNHFNITEFLLTEDAEVYAFMFHHASESNNDELIKKLMKGNLSKCPFGSVFQEVDGKYWPLIEEELCSRLSL